MRTLFRIVRDGWHLVRMIEEAHAELATQKDRSTRLGRHLSCAVQLVEERDRQLAALAGRCRRAEEELGLWRSFYAKSMPEMEA